MATPDAPTLARVSLLTAASERPVLSDDDVTAIVSAHATVDIYGLYPSDPGWSPTWDVYAAVAEAWGVKAGRVAGDFNFQADDASYSKGDVMAHCLAMQAQFAAQTSGSAAMGAYVGTWPGVVING